MLQRFPQVAAVGGYRAKRARRRRDTDAVFPVLQAEMFRGTRVAVKVFL